MSPDNEISKFFSLITLTKNLDKNLSQVNIFINACFFNKEVKASMVIIKDSIKILYEQMVEYKTKIFELNKEIVKLKNSQMISENKCSICLDNSIEHVFIECGHACICSECVTQLEKKCCPICRTNSKTIKIHFS